MRLLAIAAALLALSIGAATAGPMMKTRFGALEIVRGEVDEQIHFRGGPVRGPDGVAKYYRLGVEGVWRLGAEDVALIHIWGGGNDVCSNGYLIVAVSPRGAHATKEFGTCTTEVTDVRVLPNRIEFDLAAANPRIDHVAAVYSRGRIKQSDVPMREVAAPMPGGGAEVTRWQGVHPYTILEDPGERQRFLAIMPRKKLFELMDRVNVSSGAKIGHGWLLGSGCMAHQCGAEMGAFAIEVATGRAQAVIFHDDAPPEAFGGGLTSLHPALRAFARTGDL